MSWDLLEVSQKDFVTMPKEEKIFVHSFWGKMYKFSFPACYTNHSPNANTIADYEQFCDLATTDIKKGDKITTNATLEYKFEVESFLETREGKELEDFTWVSGGYRNAEVMYKVNGETKHLKLKRVGNWQIIS